MKDETRCRTTRSASACRSLSASDDPAVPRPVVILILGLSLLAVPRAHSGSATFCPALPPPAGSVVHVASVPELLAAVSSATPGTAILLADGVYALNGAYIRVETPGVTLRSQSGNREAVVLDGGYVTTEIVQIVASNVTLADLTLRRAYDHPIHVMSTASAATNGTLIYNVHVIDPGQQAIKINPADGTHFVDDGVVACSRIELTDVGRPHIRDSCYTGGVDAHAAEGWVIRDNEIDGFWCDSGLSEHAVHFWRASRGTRVERNLMRDNARGVGFGMATEGTGRVYPDAPCPSAGGAYVDHYGGSIENNFISAQDSGLFASDYGFDCGVCLWQACESGVTHNSVHTTNPGATFSSIEWRFSRTVATVTNNLVNAALRERDGATATLAGNVTNAQGAWYTNPASGDLHLQPGAAAAIDQGVAAGLTADIDGQARPYGTAPDVGADERAPARSLVIEDFTVTEGAPGETATGTATVTLSEVD